MAHLLAEGDPDSDVGAAWVAKELRRDVYAAVDEAHAAASDPVLRALR